MQQSYIKNKTASDKNHKFAPSLHQNFTVTILRGGIETGIMVTTLKTHYRSNGKFSLSNDYFQRKILLSSKFCILCSKKKILVSKEQKFCQFISTIYFLYSYRKEIFFLTKNGKFLNLEIQQILQVN